ncbi:MAG: glycosyltransferase family 4 protein [Bacteroidetes bacterium]|nr:glycosyltransferase family 4 protein [Bacteroidota bacterium]
MKREVFIITSSHVVNGKTAGSQRIMNIAKTLAMGKVNVFLCSLPDINNNSIECIERYPNIYQVLSTQDKKNNFPHLFNFIFSVNNFIKERKSISAIYLYPFGRVIIEWIFLIYFKFIKRHKLFCDINELRVTTLYNKTPPARLFSKIIYYCKYPFQYLRFKSSEFQACFFDGLIVISVNLEKYFSKYSSRIIRIPILCDLSKASGNFESKFFNNGAFKVCYAGTLSNKREGLGLLLKVISILNQRKNVELHLYGSIPENEEFILPELSELYKITDKVYNHGFLEPARVFLEFAQYHLLIIPRPLNKQTRYGFSTKLSEYLVSGVPTLLTDVSDNGLYIKDGYNGFIISPGSSSKMVAKINQIIENYNDWANEIVRNSYKTAIENFDYRLYTDVLIKFIFD